MVNVNGIPNAKEGSLRPDAEAILKLRILSTTDVHACLMDYDYYRDRKDAAVGLVRTATLIKKARAEAQNSLLVDNGDLIQGTPLGTFAARVDPDRSGAAGGWLHPAIRAMNAMGYDAATLGNHEFNYGLDYLDQVISGAAFPYVNANIYVHEAEAGRKFAVNRYRPYAIVTKTCLDSTGQPHDIRIGFIGFVPPQIMDWDQGHLDGKVQVKDMVLSALEWIPQMKEEGADVIVALAHSGFDAGVSLKDHDAENAVLPLSLVPGIDAIAFSHTHRTFPARDFASLDATFKRTDGTPLPAVDWQEGTINGLPAVQAGYGGSMLGIIDLSLRRVNGRWQAADGRSMIREIRGGSEGTGPAEPDSEIVGLLRQAHQQTVAYANAPIGRTETPLHTYFSLVHADASIQLLNHAQIAHARRRIASSAPDLGHLPVLSASSPFKAGRNGPNDYAEIPAGPIAIRSAAELYLFENTIKAVKISGAALKEWLEMSVGIYNRIDPDETGEQPLLNPAFPAFNFDVIGGVAYRVNVARPAKYGLDGMLLDPSAGRIEDLRHEGRPVEPEQQFIVVTSNYRVSSGIVPGLREAELVLDSADENRQALIDYIAEQGLLKARPEENWSFTRVAKPVNVTFTASPEAAKYTGDVPGISYTGRTDARGYGIYRIDLGVREAAEAAAVSGRTDVSP
ncbi:MULTISPECIES: bifunctional 2',3'-cyclic-nucleotide 2'-phosphodiesterase/3'-nucleotidase [Paenibacillus]|uniref:2',3'-cyclic-nucleotide 2'-phosphodiesterase n=1 Tax=Paenibacillus albilobatus TaxID=2716884 RepID=A0A919XP29_9BACL|nr:MULTISPECIES: bifunctional 2',3'-cyclic-nucleotide 2'-phosphodiesterase/3'-nucleotidase [Paenibacillus]GIO33935.1 hypothetical protein J2TS6_50760 [Paenibacillus albilobatus]